VDKDDIQNYLDLLNQQLNDDYRIVILTSIVERLLEEKLHEIYKNG
jgi:hypothetical protein